MANFAVRLVHGPGWDASCQTRKQDSKNRAKRVAIVLDCLRASRN